MMTDMSKDVVKLYRPAVHTDGAACMVDCKIGFWVSKPDYDALAAKLAAAEAHIAHLENHIEGVAKDTHKIMVAYEAALPAAYRLGLDDAHRQVVISGEKHAGLSASRVTDAICAAISATPTPTIAKLMARIQTGEKE